VRNVAILLFDDAEVLDFAGPFEVFSVASQVHDFKLFNVFTIAKSKEMIRAVNGLKVFPDYTVENHPKIDILIISGGQGTTLLLNEKEIINWVKAIHSTTEITMSICSGSRVLGILGLLDNLEYCTHHLVYDDMKKITPTGIPQKQKRFFNVGKIHTTGGISAGIDASFNIVEKLHGKKVAEATSKYMEYTIVKNYDEI
jgi:transcriptional regulator GlxA family with amidase domain